LQASSPEAPQIAAAAPLSPVARVTWAVLIIATLGICYFSHLGALGFVGPDEPRYAWIARDMAETGDWVTPRLYGKPWFEKPPLYYWSAALSFKLFGVSETAARLPSAIAALLATLAMAWLAWRLYGPETARWLLLLLPTSVGMIGFSHAAATDMLFAATLTLALVAACVILRFVPGRNGLVIGAQHGALQLGTLATSDGVIPSEEPQSVAARSRGTLVGSSQDANHLNKPRILPLVLFGFFLGLAVLAKGPAGIVLLGGAVFFWALFTKSWRDAFRLLHPAALVAFCLAALPWYVFCARRNPDFLRIFIIEHNFKRYLTPEFQHGQPFWYYAAVLLVAFLPCTALLLWSAVSGTLRLWRTRRIGDAILLLLCWSVFCALFFTISSSKLPGYILPAIPAIALLMSRVVAENPSRKSLRASVLAVALLLTVGFLAVHAIASRSTGRNLAAGIAAGQVVRLLALANLVLFAGLWLTRVKRVGTAAIPLAVLPVLIAILVSDRFFPAFFYWDPSGKTIAAELQRANIPGSELTVKRMRRGQRYSLSFYLRQEIPEWDRDHPREGYVLAADRVLSGSSVSPFTYDEIAFDVEKTGFFLYRARQTSVAAASSGGEMK